MKVFGPSKEETKCIFVQLVQVNEVTEQSAGYLILQKVKLDYELWCYFRNYETILNIKLQFGNGFRLRAKSVPDGSLYFLPN